MTQEVEAEFIEAVEWLDKKGVSAITGDCGFMMYFQKLAREYAYRSGAKENLIFCHKKSSNGACDKIKMQFAVIKFEMLFIL